MIIKPRKYTYHTQLDWLREKKGCLNSLGKPSIMVACPPEWGGHPDIWSPEDLFIGSLEVCILTTFLYYIKSHKINLVSYKSKTEGIASMVDNVFQFSSISIHITITVSNVNEKKATEDIIKKVQKKCLISQSIKPHIKIIPDININK